jgi:hypothetical protein
MEAVHDEDQLEAVDFDTWLKEQAQSVSFPFPVSSFSFLCNIPHPPAPIVIYWY